MSSESRSMRQLEREWQQLESDITSIDRKIADLMRERAEKAQRVQKIRREISAYQQRTGDALECDKEALSSIVRNSLASLGIAPAKDLSAQVSQLTEHCARATHTLRHPHSHQPTTTTDDQHDAAMSAPAVVEDPIPQKKNDDVKYIMHRRCIYESDLDTNGFFYWLNTSVLRSPGKQLKPSEHLEVSASQVRYGRVMSVVDRNFDNGFTRDLKNSWICIKLKHYAIQPTHYTYCTSKAEFEWALRNWELQASTDGENWDAISTHKDDLSLSNKQPSACTWRVHCKQPYTSFRIFQTGPNAGFNNRLVFGNIELYGMVYYVAPQNNNSTNTTNMNTTTTTTVQPSQLQSQRGSSHPHPQSSHGSSTSNNSVLSTADHQSSVGEGHSQSGHHQEGANGDVGDTTDFSRGSNNRPHSTPMDVQSPVSTHGMMYHNPHATTTSTDPTNTRELPPVDYLTSV
eukprot:TRINITY_DN53479_c0_g2_i1.p1 TRINITY_DN53479_c0_g2~~TRINITY_DN53479_c0_g2_i1.p1  ORF type:complete len:490 (+),score=28.64 TRINITY_DN53479_c0_g2_i1:98-1471(+)